MATKLVKIISNQSGPFNVSNNLVDITLPAYLGACDLSDTCVELNLKMKQSDGTAIDDLFDYGFAITGRLDSTCLIKNVKFSSDKGGVLEEIAQPNILHANLSPFETDFEARQDDWYYGQSGHRRADGNSGQFNFGTFIDKVDNGTTLSKQRTSLKLPLTSLLGIAKMKQFSNKLFGDCKIHLEFEDNLSTVATLFEQYVDNTVYTGAVNATAKTLTLTNQLVPNGNNVWNGMPIDSVVADAPIDALSTANPAVISIKGPTTAPAQKYIQPKVGDTIIISGVTGTDKDDINGTFTANALVPNSTEAELSLNSSGKSFDATNAKITVLRTNGTVLSSSYSQSAKTVVYTLSDDDFIQEAEAGALSPTLVGTQSFQARRNSVVSTDLTYEIEDVHIIVPQYLLSPAQVNSMESKMKRGVNMNFLTYEVERINMPSIVKSTQYDRQFDLRSGVINAMMLTPTQNNLLSITDGASSFRWRLNGLEQTNRDIVINQSLYNDRLLSVLSSGNIKVRNLAPNSFIAPQSVPLSPEQQVLQIRLNQGSQSDSTAKILFLYKQVRRAIKASNSMVQVV